ncbi:MAG: flagellar hook-basal body complex protein FliE [Burkholderiales bacterium]|nr:flagellar hook-basal body complex protein FliE [Burkholderiales bacterium]
MNDLSLKPFDFQAALARAGLRADGTPRAQGASGTSGAAGAVGAAGGGFGAAMASALHDVSQSQLQAQSLQRELTLGNPNVSVEQTMLAMQKAQIGFQAVVQVRNRFAQAYTDIMNMQV